MDRPTYIDISAASSRAPSSAAASRSGHPSPRIQYFDGDIPPVLSPLDAFAAESRRLAKELEATRIAGERRMSRLSPQIVTKSLSQHTANRPACFRSLSTTADQPPVPRQDSYTTRIGPEITEPQRRPQSSYPRISAVLQDDDEDEVYSTPRELSIAEHPNDYFDLERTHLHTHSSDTSQNPSHLNHFTSTDSQNTALPNLAPPSAPFARNKPYNESSDDDYTSSNAGSTFSQPLPRKMSNSSATSFPTSPAMVSHERTPSEKSDASSLSLSKGKLLFNFSRPMSQASNGLRIDSPTRAPSRFLERKPSHLSEDTRGFTSFEDDRSIMSDSVPPDSANSYTHRKFILPRGKVSEKASQRVSQLFSGLSTPDFRWVEPMFPGSPPLSAQTDGGFFTPASLPYRPSLDPAPQSAWSTGFAFGFEQDPAVRNSEDERPSSSRTAPEVNNALAPSVARPSTSHGPSPSQSGLGIDQGLDSTLQRPFTSQLESNSSFESFAVRAAALQKAASPVTTDFNKSFNSSGTRLYTSQNASSFDRNKMPTLPPIPGSTADDMSSRAETETQRSASTVRPTTARSHSDYQALTADEHVDKAIELHQFGDLKESTYHLRIASKQNHPTGMLLYALACRHGWGMRANPKEGVALLRRAVDMTMMEVAEDEDSSSSLPKADFIEKKSHRAQFALGIYELGVSHLNGWGVEQDKALALRCFEIAGNWGDADALTEAGFCYTQGIGCKKNLKVAASFYRQAADKGVSMVGNSWIYKDKYNDDNDKNDTKKSRSRKESLDEKEKNLSTAAAAATATLTSTTPKSRNKSRTRSIFGRRRAATAALEKEKEKEKGTGFL